MDKRLSWKLGRMEFHGRLWNKAVEPVCLPVDSLPFQKEIFARRDSHTSNGQIAALPLLPLSQNKHHQRQN